LCCIHEKVLGSLIEKSNSWRITLEPYSFLWLLENNQYWFIENLGKKNIRLSYDLYAELIKERMETMQLERSSGILIYISNLPRKNLALAILAVITDLFTHVIRGWGLSYGLDENLTLVALRRALQSHIPPIHHSY